MTALGDAIRLQRTERGWTLAHLADLVGMSPSTLAKKERGEVTVSPAQRRLFAKAFGMNQEEFDRLWRATRVDLVRGESGIPVINRAPAGIAINYEEYGTDSGQGYEYLDRGNVTDEHAFAVVIVGDSMQPLLHEGDYVVFSPVLGDQTPTNGRVVFVRFSPSGPASIAGSCTVARMYVDGRMMRLAKENRAYPDVIVPLDVDHVARIAVAIEMRTNRGLGS